MLEPLSRVARTEVVAYLSRRPYENAFMQWIVEGGLGMATAYDSIAVWRSYNRLVAGVGFFGPQIALAADDVAAIDGFAFEARERPRARMIVGPRHITNHFWARIKSWYREPTLIRPSQPLYAIDHMPAGGDDIPIRQARASDLEMVAANSAEMMVGELGYDPREHRTNFMHGISRLIERGWWWVWIENGELLFQCNVGSRTARTAQVQGVWTPPAQRGKGYATRAMRAICRRLLNDVPTLSLYVNDFNTKAIELYERVGFERVGEFTTYLFNEP
ncbi:MAG: GNAT family N-acetyltransferase [Vulcanimicrobiaceae bacterium]|jgi:RimJ/RimL family protein N-acetyltransferase